MKIQWKFADGTTSEVEVNEEIGNYITASRREESNLARKERYHCYSLDAIDFEGLEYGAETTPEIELTHKEDAVQIKTALDKLSATCYNNYMIKVAHCKEREELTADGKKGTASKGDCEHEIHYH